MYAVATASSVPQAALHSRQMSGAAPSMPAGRQEPMRNQQPVAKGPSHQGGAVPTSAAPMPSRQPMAGMGAKQPPTTAKQSVPSGPGGGYGGAGRSGQALGMAHHMNGMIAAPGVAQAPNGGPPMMNGVPSYRNATLGQVAEGPGVGVAPPPPPPVPMSPGAGMQAGSQDLQQHSTIDNGDIAYSTPFMSAQPPGMSAFGSPMPKVLSDAPPMDAFLATSL